MQVTTKQVTTKEVSNKQLSPNQTLNKSDSKSDAIAILMQDHSKVKKLFKEFEKLSKNNNKSKVDIANQICLELIVHAQAEEEIFYNKARKTIHDNDLMNEADVEHDSAKNLIAQIQTLNPEDEMYDAKITVLGEYIDHHVKEEESEMFPKVRKAKVDLIELGKRLKVRKEEIKLKMMDVDGNIKLDVLKKMALEAASTKH